MIHRSIAPPITDALAFDLRLPKYEKYVLRNGVDVYALALGEQETMMVNWVFNAGNWFEEKNLVAAAANYLLKNGTSRHSAFDISEKVEYHGAFLSRSCQQEFADLTLHCLTKHLADLLPLVAELLADTQIPESELSIFKKNSQQRLQVGLRKNDFVAGRLIDAYLFGAAHPYGKFSSLEDYANLQQAEILEFYKKYYQQGRCALFVAGKLPGNLRALLDEHFGGLPLRPLLLEVDSSAHRLEPSTERRRHLINDPDGVQGAIRIARPFPNRHHPDFQKVQVLNHVFGGFFSSRLMANIREDKGYTYGIYSYLENHLQQSAWMISTEAGRDVCEATIREVYAEMERLREELVEEEELQTTRNAMIGTLLGDLDGPFQVLGRWKNILLNGLDESYFHRGVEIVKTLDAASLRELAQKYLQPEAFYELVVI